VLRIESERDAVQIMTVHKSKGLEADVVFLFGGTHGEIQVGDWPRSTMAASGELRSEKRRETRRSLHSGARRARRMNV